VVFGGALIKGTIDASLDEQRAYRALIEQRKERRSKIIEEFVNIFSLFYSVRKLYHSANDHADMYDPNSSDYAGLIRELLRKSTELEGRYGALKTLAIQHFGLPYSDLSTKRNRIPTLKARIKAPNASASDGDNDFTLIRDELDLLGELYDEWRHAFEEKRGISDDVSKDVWEAYEVLLKFLATSEGLPGQSGSHTITAASVRSFPAA
jgi:hypothetical protein